MNKISVIYQIINTKNGKFYVGSLKDCYARKGRHFRHLKNRTHYNDYLQRSFDKYGESSFVFLVLEEDIPENSLLSIEQLYLDEISKDKQHSMNAGFIAGRVEMTDEIKQKIRITRIGKKMSEVTKKKLSELGLGEKNHFFGKHHTQESKKKIGKKGEKHPFFGKRHSEASKRKISKANKGRVLSVLTRKNISLAKKGVPRSKEAIRKTQLAIMIPIKQLDKITGNIIKIWPSMKDASISLGISNGYTGNISRACSKIKPSAYGFKWEYA